MRSAEEEKIIKLLHRRELADHRVPVDWNTEFLLASQRGYIKYLKLVLQEGANPSHMNEQRDNALNLASRKGHVDVVTFLLEKGVDPSCANEEGNNALHLASANGHYDVVWLLLTYTRNITCLNKNGRNALHLAAINGHSNVVGLLLLNKIDIGCITKTGRNALHLASFKGNKDVVKLLLHHGADIARVDSDGFTALHLASFYGHKGAVEVLLENRADIISENGPGRYLNVLHLAASKGHRDVVDLLIRYNWDKNRVDKNGRTPLHLASLHGHTDAVECLLRYNADINCVDNDGCNPLHLASSQGHINIVKLLVNEGVDTTLLNEGGENALQIATKNGHEDVVKLLASIKIYFPSDTLLHEAKPQLEPYTKFRLNKLFRRTYLDFKGALTNQTALHYAAEQGNLNIVKILHESYASLYVTNKDGDTALDLAKKKQHHTVVKYLEAASTMGKASTKNLKPPLPLQKVVPIPENYGTKDRKTSSVSSSDEDDVGKYDAVQSPVTSEPGLLLHPNTNSSTEECAALPLEKSGGPRPSELSRSPSTDTKAMTKTIEAVLQKYQYTLSSYGTFPRTSGQTPAIFIQVQPNVTISGQNVVCGGNMYNMQDQAKDSSDDEIDHSGTEDHSENEEDRQTSNGRYSYSSHDQCDQYKISYPEFEFNSCQKLCGESLVQILFFVSSSSSTSTILEINGS